MTRLDDVLIITGWLKAHGLRVRIDTIGHALLHYPGRDVAYELKKAGINEISISLNAHDKKTYDWLVRPGKYTNAYNSMQEFARDIVKQDMKLTFTILTLPQVDIEKCREKADEIGAAFRIRGYAGPDLQE